MKIKYLLLSFLLIGCGTTEITRESSRTEVHDVNRTVDTKTLQDQRMTFEFPQRLFIDLFMPDFETKPDSGDIDLEPIKVTVETKTETTQREEERAEITVEEETKEEEVKDTRSFLQRNSFWIGIAVAIGVIVLLGRLL